MGEDAGLAVQYGWQASFKPGLSHLILDSGIRRNDGMVDGFERLQDNHWGLWANPKRSSHYNPASSYLHPE